MIAKDQPTIFPRCVTVAVSSVEDGSMKDGVSLTTASAVVARQNFLHQLNLSSDQAAIIYADFATIDFCNYQTARPGLMPGADAAATNQLNQPILLPIADCVAAVLYDPVNHAIMLSHLGRHSTEQFGGVKSVEYMTDQFSSCPEDLLVWLGPSPNGQEYPLWKFNNRSFVDVLTEQLSSASVQTKNIEISPIDTTTNANYFSHSQFLKGRQNIDGRYAVVVALH